MIKQVRLTIAGTSPLLLNRFTDEEQAKASAGTSVSVMGAQGSPREQAEPRLYVDTMGQPVFPGPNFFSCLVEAGKFHKVGKNKVTTGRSSLVPAAVSVMEVESLLEHRGWEVDSRPIVNPATRGRRLRHRPRFDEWSVSFTLAIDTSIFDPKFVRQLVDDAGARIGLGDFRPDRKGPFGRFKVTSWEEQP